MKTRRDVYVYLFSCRTCNQVQSPLLLVRRSAALAESRVFRSKHAGHDMETTIERATVVKK